VFHTFVGERIDDWRNCRELVKKIAYNFKIPYFTITPTFSICPQHGYLAGEKHICPKCESECEVWSRVMGYMRPVKQWNTGKKSEFRDRKMFKLKTKAGV